MRKPPGIAFLLILLVAAGCSKKGADQDAFGRLSREGKKYYESGDPAKAIGALEDAAKLEPNNRDAHLNLANALLAANQSERAVAEAGKALQIDQTSGAAHYLQGSAYLRFGQAENAVKSLQQAKEADRTINAVSFQLGRAQQSLGNFETAAKEFEEVVQYEPDHPAAHYALSQTYLRLGQSDSAATELAEHQRVSAGQPGPVTDLARFERCRYTRIVVPFKLEEPNPKGVAVKFADATSAVLEGNAGGYRGPAAVLDVNHDGWPELFVRAEGKGLLLLTNQNGVLRAAGEAIPDEGSHNRVLVGDLNNDQVEDVLWLGAQGVRAFKFDTNGMATDVTRFSKLNGLSATNGVLMDLDYSGTLDLLLLGTNGFKAARNFGHPFFTDCTTNFVGAAEWSGWRGLFVEDWNRDDLLDVIVTRSGQPPLLVARQREGQFVATNAFANLPAADLVTVGDLNNDTLPDLVLVAGNQLICAYAGLERQVKLAVGIAPVRALELVDYDNDGWLDILAAGQGMQAWRNLGQAGFTDATPTLAVGNPGAIQSFSVSDLDGDCDSDLVLNMADGSLRVLRNDGGNANHALKVRLVGTKSNASGLGIRVELTGEGLHLSRRVQQVPVYLGVGANKEVESLAIHWFDFTLATVDLKTEPCALFIMQELGKQEGSCPYLYAWDGRTFRFVSDLLGASPLGLPLSESRIIEADPEEYVWIGNDEQFPAKDGEHVLQVTEELREVLYLDEAKLVVVDHPPQTEVHTTGKLLPGPPFPAHELVTLGSPHPLRQAVDDMGRDVTAELREMDQRFVSPPRLRSTQLKGLAEPFAVTLDFGSLDPNKPLALAITAWLRFGGATVNVSASLDPNLPFPFPTLEVERGDGKWEPVKVDVGAPAGKTKNMMVDLTGRLPADSKRLRLKTAFEIHWDRIALLERISPASTQVRSLSPARTDLHWRGFSADYDWPWYLPLTPEYGRVHERPIWRWTPSGWCTRYGAVDELVSARDNALVLLNGGDELTLSFATAQLPPKPKGYVRDFFYYSVGWDKDANIHCVRGNEVGPLPWYGMNAQRYGEEQRPPFPNDDWIKRYNTRWVGPRTVVRR